MTATPESAALGGLDGVEIKLNFDAAQIDDACASSGSAPTQESRAGFGSVRSSTVSSGRASCCWRAESSCDGGIDTHAWPEGAGKSQNAKIEGDWAGKRLVSASLGNDLDEVAVEELKAAHPSVAQLLSPEQRNLATQMLVPLEHVELLGPIEAQKWEAETDGDAEAELWEVDALRTRRRRPPRSCATLRPGGSGEASKAPAAPKDAAAAGRQG